jgi:hypothetical protein
MSKIDERNQLTISALIELLYNKDIIDPGEKRKLYKVLYGDKL